jgi:hypothetical protein
MDTNALEALGFTREEVADRVVAAAVAQLMRQVRIGEDGEEAGEMPSEFARRLNLQVQSRIDEAIAAIVAKHILPNAQSYVESVTLQATNKWGEARGKPVSFLEYLTQRAEAYMTEEVDHSGKPKGTDSFGWRGRQTRIAHMVHEHLHYHIERAMKEALTVANSAIARGIEETVKLKLAEVVAGIKAKVEVKT